MHPSAARWIKRIALLAAATVAAGCTAQRPQAPTPLPARAEVTLDSLGIRVGAAENRPVSFTNKRSAYYYTQTHRNDHEEHTGFAGFNVAQKRIFAGHEITVGGRRLDGARTDVEVFPDRLVRRWPEGLSETLRLVDGEDIVDIEIGGTDEPIDIRLLGDGVRRVADAGGVTTWSTMEAPDRTVVARVSGRRIVIALVPADADAGAASRRAVALADTGRAPREARLVSLLNGRHYVQASDPRRTTALRWLRQTMDQLVTRQRGDGIYAGLPWFAEYWGRDSFIALPGALLVTGEFETARAVLTSFAEFQDLDPSSKFYGRVPNIVKVDALDYHTVDGTPRFVIALRDYIRYSGDRSIVAELYPAVRASIEGALANWVDERGFLTHADNESWMDARRAGDLVPYSPRGTRANDIQALWHAQLLAGAWFAGLVGDADSATRWQQAASTLASSFQAAFASAGHDYLADRLKADDTPDFQLRPNQLYALDLLDDPLRVARATRAAWENLVFPWGVASLAPSDPFFHPYHLARDRYHKDEAYHNGTVWLWNNGIAMQRMIELGQVEPAWTLFENMNEQVLTRGVVGGLGENMDAYPRPGQSWPRLTGTYLQAWSNSEQLRVWYQGFLGVRPDIADGLVTLAPRLPEGFGSVDFSARIGDGSIRGVYETRTDAVRYDWVAEGIAFEARLDLRGFPVQSVSLRAGQRLSAFTRRDAGLEIRVYDARGALSRRTHVEPDAMLRAHEVTLDRIFDGLQFAVPRELDSHPVMQ
jgi:glycogen debranching enzyme